MWKSTQLSECSFTVVRRLRTPSWPFTLLSNADMRYSCVFIRFWAAWLSVLARRRTHCAFPDIPWHIVVLQSMSALRTSHLEQSTLHTPSSWPSLMLTTVYSNVPQARGTNWCSLCLGRDHTFLPCATHADSDITEIHNAFTHAALPVCYIGEHSSLPSAAIGSTVPSLPAVTHSIPRIRHARFGRRLGQGVRVPCCMSGSS